MDLRLPNLFTGYTSADFEPYSVFRANEPTCWTCLTYFIKDLRNDERFFEFVGCAGILVFMGFDDLPESLVSRVHECDLSSGANNIKRTRPERKPKFNCVRNILCSSHCRGDIINLFRCTVGLFLWGTIVWDSLHHQHFHVRAGWLRKATEIGRLVK